MWLERFNHYGKFIDFDPDRRLWVEANSIGEGAEVVGIADLLGGEVVAMVCMSGDLYLYIGQDRFSLQDPEVALTYAHMDDGTTTFAAADRRHTAQVAYRSWWHGTGAGVAAFGSSSDEEEDVCAYIKFMLGAETRKKHVMTKYA